MRFRYIYMLSLTISLYLALGKSSEALSNPNISIIPIFSNGVAREPFRPLLGSEKTRLEGILSLGSSPYEDMPYSIRMDYAISLALPIGTFITSSPSNCPNCTRTVVLYQLKDSTGQILSSCSVSRGDVADFEMKTIRNCPGSLPIGNYTLSVTLVGKSPYHSNPEASVAFAVLEAPIPLDTLQIGPIPFRHRVDYGGFHTGGTADLYLRQDGTFSFSHMVRNPREVALCNQFVVGTWSLIGGYLKLSTSSLDQLRPRCRRWHVIGMEEEGFDIGTVDRRYWLGFWGGFTSNIFHFD